MRESRLRQAHREHQRDRTVSGKQTTGQKEDLVAAPWQAIHAPIPTHPIPTFTTRPEENSPVLTHVTSVDVPFGRWASSSSLASSNPTGNESAFNPTNIYPYENSQAYGTHAVCDMGCENDVGG